MNPHTSGLESPTTGFISKMPKHPSFSMSLNEKRVASSSEDIPGVLWDYPVLSRQEEHSLLLAPRPFSDSVFSCWGAQIRSGETGRVWLYGNFQIRTVLLPGLGDNGYYRTFRSNPWCSVSLERSTWIGRCSARTERIYLSTGKLRNILPRHHFGGDIPRAGSQLPNAPSSLFFPGLVLFPWIPSVDGIPAA